MWAELSDKEEESLQKKMIWSWKEKEEDGNQEMRDLSVVLSIVRVRIRTDKWQTKFLVSTELQNVQETVEYVLSDIATMTMKHLPIY